MPPFWENIVAGVVIAIVSALGSAIVTVHLAFRRFRAEKWWEKKAEAYSRTIDALVAYKCALADHLGVFGASGDREAAQFRQATVDIIKCANTSRVFICTEASKRLRAVVAHIGDMHKKLESSESEEVVSSCKSQIEVVDAFLDDIGDTARFDLHV